MNATGTGWYGSRSVTAFALAMALALGACSEAPRETEKLVAARVAMQRIASLETSTGPARSDYNTARANLQMAEAALKKGRPLGEVDQLAYIAEQSAMAALSRQEAATLQQRLDSAPGGQSAQQQQDQKRDANMALHRAETAEMEAARVQQLIKQEKAAD